MPDTALSDVRVLDLSDNIAGAYCAQLLASCGADVIKIEPPLHGDPARASGPFPGDLPDQEKSGLFMHLNGNKKGITLDITSDSGQAVLKKLVTKADVLIETFAPTYLPSLGLGFQDLEHVNPALVMTSITPFGQTGPYKDFKATDIGVFAMSGRMYVHGLPGMAPLPYAPDVIWYQVGATAAAATMGGLFNAKFQGVGQQVDVSALESLIGNVDSRCLFYEYTGVKTTRERWPGGIPQGAYPCRDGYIVIGVGYDVYFRRLCDAMGRPDICQDPRWVTIEARTRNSEEFEAIFIEWLMQHSKIEVFNLCQAHRVMCAPVLSFEEMMQDPQLVARSFFTQVDHPIVGTLPAMGAPFKMTETPLQNPGPSPTLGQHNVEVLSADLGYSLEEIAQLKTRSVI